MDCLLSFVNICKKKKDRVITAPHYTSDLEDAFQGRWVFSLPLNHIYADVLTSAENDWLLKLRLASMV